MASKVHVEALAYLVASPLIMMHASATTILHIYIYYCDHVSLAASHTYIAAAA